MMGYEKRKIAGDFLPFTTIYTHPRVNCKAGLLLTGFIALIKMAFTLNGGVKRWMKSPLKTLVSNGRTTTAVLYRGVVWLL